jgi:uncharacterized Zn-finger protein
MILEAYIPELTQIDSDHIRRLHARRFECNLCQSRFNLKTDLERHQRCRHGEYKEGEIPESWTCNHDPCISPGRVFMRKDNFRRHVKRCIGSSTKDNVQ